MDVEEARGADLGRVARVGIAHAHEQAADVLEVHLVAHGEGRAREVTRAHGRHAAEQGVRARDHDDLVTCGQMGHGVAPGADNGVVGRLVGPREVAALGVAGHVLASDPGRKRPGGAVGGLLAGHDEEAGPRVGSPDCGHDQRPGGLRHGERRVVTGGELVGEGVQFGCGKQLPRDSVYQHGTIVPTRPVPRHPHSAACPHVAARCARVSVLP